MKKLFALMCLTFLAACGGGDGGGSTGPSANPAGTYTIRSINGGNLPYTVPGSTANESLVVTAGSVTLNNDGTYSESTSYTARSGTTTVSDTERYTGTWSRMGNNISVTATGLGSYSMAWDGGSQLTQVEDGLTVIYRK